MQPITYLLYCLFIGLLAFATFFLLSRKLANGTRSLHAFYVCFLAPFLVALATMILMQPDAPTSEMGAKIMSGEVIDPGPAAFVTWASWVGGPLVLYLVISIPLFFLSGKISAR